MPEEILAGGILRTIGQILGWAILEIGYHLICYTVGFVFVRVVTLGKRPKDPSKYEDALSILGFLILITPCLVYWFT